MVSKLFDPLGIISPIMIQAKLMVQECWKRKIDWDDPVLEDISKTWQEWAASLKDLPEVKVQRVLIPADSEKRLTKIEIHTFSDASMSAYGAIAYIRVEYEDGSTYVNFIASKNKIAPTKQTSIPRLELLGALAAARLADTIATELQIRKEDCVFWCDSKNVLYWLKNEKDKLKLFVSNRVSEILRRTEGSEWRYVPSKTNPADIISRGCALAELLKKQFWFRGPSFLSSDRSGWPEDISPHLNEEAKSECKELETSFVNRAHIGEESQGLFDFRRFSHWRRLKRTAMCVISAAERFKDLLREKNERNSGKRPRRVKKNFASLEKEDDKELAQRALRLLVKQDQEEFFPSELQSLGDSGQVKLNSPLAQLWPRLDKDGIIRMNSRAIDTKFISEEARQPIILAKRSYLVLLLTRHTHENILHHTGGHLHTLHEMRQRFWPISCKEIAKKTVRECVRCKSQSTTNSTEAESFTILQATLNANHSIQVHKP